MPRRRQSDAHTRSFAWSSRATTRCPTDHGAHQRLPRPTASGRPRRQPRGGSFRRAGARHHAATGGNDGPGHSTSTSRRTAAVVAGRDPALQPGPGPSSCISATHAASTVAQGSVRGNGAGSITSTSRPARQAHAAAAEPAGWPRQRPRLPWCSSSQYVGRVRPPATVVVEWILATRLAQMSATGGSHRGLMSTAGQPTS